MSPVAIAGTPDGLGALTTTQKVLGGAALLALVYCLLKAKR